MKSKLIPLFAIVALFLFNLIYTVCLLFVNSGRNKYHQSE